MQWTSFAWKPSFMKCPSCRACEECDRAFADDSPRACPGCKQLLPPTFFSRGASRKCVTCVCEQGSNYKRVAGQVPVDKVCKHCGVKLPARSFQKAPSATGLKANCRTCHTTLNREHALRLGAIQRPSVAAAGFKRRCSACGDVKSLYEFHLNKYNYTDGRQSVCKACQNSQQAKRRGQ